MTAIVRLAIHQPNYAPWCGYFAKMRNCDLFVFLDDAQMPGGQSYVYRTQIRGRQSTQWLSVPTRFRLGMAVRDVQFADPSWARKHVGTLRAVYARCPYFKEVFPFLEPIYAEPGERLAPFNERLVRAVAAYLDFPCRFEIVEPTAARRRRRRSLDFPVPECSGPMSTFPGRAGRTIRTRPSSPPQASN